MGLPHHVGRRPDPEEGRALLVLLFAVLLVGGFGEKSLDSKDIKKLIEEVSAKYWKSKGEEVETMEEARK